MPDKTNRLDSRLKVDLYILVGSSYMFVTYKNDMHLINQSFAEKLDILSFVTNAEIVHHCCKENKPGDNSK